MSRYSHVSELFQDGVVGDYIAELLDAIDDVLTMEYFAPPRLRRQFGGAIDVGVDVVGSGTHDDPYDLTGGDDDADLLPVSTRLDFTLVCDELDNNGLFGSRS
jgi:hypothetical protein